ncbi:RDD family protein [Vibrio sp. LaRot3]|uniref:RDD family protein n=1 Tax=Vibrio sp. LaRot3 TaxID=2998829 RepID=UPI0022CDEE49|nr:RDD family protein [Vibrio sp. LaRot3]MDA0149812.1 RDD family protein [Vibrio sp. LaRot3]
MNNENNDELASRWARLGAGLIDFAIWSVAIAVAFAPIYVEYSTSPMALSIFSLFTVLGVLYINLSLMYKHGQTIGKKMLDIAIVDMEGRQATLRRIIFFRSLPITLLSAIPIIGSIITVMNCLMIFRGDKRCMHDLIADTQVINAKAPSRITA